MLYFADDREKVAVSGDAARLITADDIDSHRYNDIDLYEKVR